MTGEAATNRRFTFIVVAIAAAVALCILAFLLAAAFRNGSDDRQRLIDMTNSFVATYAGMRDPSGPVPAEFRRAGIEHFSPVDGPNAEDGRSRMRMPGTPGREIGTIEQDLRLARIIENMAWLRVRDPHVEHRIEDGRIIGRTVSPSVASGQSCVDCHNSILGAGTYEVGDIMGAFVVERDMTVDVVVLLAAAFAVFVFVLVIGGWVARNEQRRSRQVVAGLRKAMALQREKAEAVEYASFLASHDGLTGLPNRNQFIERMDGMLTDRQGRDFLLALIDADDFKAVNDTFGHAGGDAFLAATGERLSRLAEQHGGLTARLGGDEFALAIPAAGAEAADDLGFELVALLTAEIGGEGFVLNPSFSIGIASSAALSDPDTDTLSRAADAALYEAKRAGKGRYQTFNEAIRDAMWRRTELAEALKSAIEDNRVQPFFQPKVDLSTGRVVGFEALARWQHQDEWISPEEFVAIAEENGMVHDLDMAILSVACTEIAALNARLGRDFSIAANLSPANFRHLDLDLRIGQILQRTGFDPRKLVLEITETVMVENWHEVERLLKPVRDKGVQISLDDFGTGYTSLAYLSEFSFDEIKIDRSFVAGIDASREAEFLFRTLLTMARGLKKRVVAEGIETEAQRDRARALRGQIGQGYFFAKPMPPDQIPAFLDGLEGQGAKSA